MLNVHPGSDAVTARHPFNDGNKRTSFVVTELFLYLNGWVLDVSDEAFVVTWLRLAAGAVSDEELAAWIDRQRSPRTRDEGDMLKGSGNG